jgi:hypothetical protein
MEAFYNQEKNQYILAANRCGTVFLTSNVVKNLGWIKINITANDLSLIETASVVKIIRDPYQRWRSWFNSFVLTKYKFWNAIESKKWINNFKINYKDDYHTEKLSVIYNQPNLIKNNTLYLAMKDLNLFLKISNQPHQHNFCDYYSCLSQQVQFIFEREIKKLYYSDYDWIKKLQTLTF